MNVLNYKVWILIDAKAGDTSQCMGVAQKLSHEYGTITADELKKSGVQAFINEHVLSQPQPVVLISANNETMHHASHIKRLAGDRVFNVKLGCVTDEEARAFDLVASPIRLDDKKPGLKNKLLHTVGVAHKVTPQMIEQGKRQWGSEFEKLKHPLIAVLVGGTISQEYPFTPAMAKKMGKELSDYARQNGASLVITNSRRTSAAATQALRDAITVPYDFYDQRKGGENPYFGLLGLADGFIVSGDSTSMLCEACATGKPVYCYPLPEVEMGPQTYLQLQLELAGQIRKFNGQSFESWRSERLDTAGDIANAITAQLQRSLSAATPAL